MRKRRKEEPDLKRARLYRFPRPQPSPAGERNARAGFIAGFVQHERLCLACLLDRRKAAH